MTIKSDLPVHCKREEIEGEWIFRINSDIFNPDLNYYKTSCGHGFPDKIEKNVGDVNYYFESYRDISLILSKDYKIYEINSSNVVGKWTPVYDEGFIVYYKNYVFTAFMKYYLKEKTNLLKPSDNQYLSNCDKTMIGWVINDINNNDKNWSCFFGFKTFIKNEFSKDNKNNNNRNFLKFNNNLFNKFEYVSKDYLNSDNNKSKNAYENNSYLNEGIMDLNYFNSDNDNKNIEEGFENESFLELKSKNNLNLNLNSWMSRYEEQIEIVNEINNSDLSWRAEINKEFKGLSFLQLKEKMGIRNNKKSLNLSFNNNLYKNDIKNQFDKESSFDSIESELNEDYDMNIFAKSINHEKKTKNSILNESYDFGSQYNNDFLEYNLQNSNMNSSSSINIHLLITAK